MGYGGFNETREQAAERVRRERDNSNVTYYPAREEYDYRFRARKKRVAIYARVSTDGVSQVTSFELQKKHYFKMVMDRPDWEPVGVYLDEGISATSTMHRDGLKQMILDVEAGLIDLVITKSMSRLSRNVVDAITIITGFKLLDPPVPILFESENINTLDQNADFAIYIHAMLAEEESHKKSLAMKSSYAARFALHQYMKPALLGYDKAGINEIILNPEEAETVHLMTTMYLAGYHPKVIAQTLTELDRKTHTHVYRDGRIKEGVVKWSASSVISYLKNERRCGDVITQKSFVVDFKTHQSRSNDDHKKAQFRAKDDHEAIITREEYELANRLIQANKGGWKRGIPQMQIVTEGALKGFVIGAPDWLGFKAEDYNRACLSAYGATEEALAAVEKRIYDAKDDSEKGIPAAEFQHVYKPTQQDFMDFVAECYGDGEDKEPEEIETFGTWTDRLGDLIRIGDPDIAGILNEEIRSGVISDGTGTQSTEASDGYDFSGCDLIGMSMFSTAGKACATFDSRGIQFSKTCLNRLGKHSDADVCLEKVRIGYNSAERAIAVMLPEDEREVEVPFSYDAEEGFSYVSAADPMTVRWSRERDGTYEMRRCGMRGLSGAIYENMEWNTDYRYKVFGTVLDTVDGPVLLFRLDDPVTIVRVKERNGLKRSQKRQRRADHDGFNPQDFELFTNEAVEQQVAEVIRKIDSEADPAPTARSRVEYYNDMIGRGGRVSLEDLGEKKFEPEFIEQMITRGLAPIEGWDYLEGIVSFRDDFRGFSILPGTHHTDWGRVKNKLIGTRTKSSGSAYGWTVGLVVPSDEDVEREIERLRA